MDTGLIGVVNNWAQTT